MAGNQNFGNIIFRSGDDNYQQEQFERFQQRGVASTRYPDLTCLQQLGLLQGIEWMLRKADLTFLCTHNQPTYPSLTLEFLSSYDYTTPAGEGEFLTGTATFRMFNTEYSLTQNQLSTMLQFTTEGQVYPKIPPDLNWNTVGVFDLFKKISGIETYNWEELLLSHIHNPTIRYFLRILQNTVLVDQTTVRSTQRSYFSSSASSNRKPSYCRSSRLIKNRVGGSYYLMVNNQAVPSVVLPNTTLTDVTNPDRHLYDLSAPETTEPSQTNQQTDEFEEMEQGDHPPTQQSVPLNPSRNAAGPSSQRRRRRRPATNDDIMDAIDGMQAQNAEMMQMMRQMQQQQDARNAITDQRFTELFSRFDNLDIRQRSPGPRTRGGRQP
ncbi:hypothetical protein KIW84_058329 [Lathyrus oleraceus]|uniref:Arabidopsis retrotransposon Orf1 C-terminal domain-containing protein n=1 Tax=Pisum sativum TaxID=3888 RepID=A0A9D5ANX0_PEA|nr:hypothetical protein KIW84_058329 [Pisum sativum]